MGCIKEREKTNNVVYIKYGDVILFGENGSLCKANMKREGKRYYCPLFTKSEKK